MADPEPGPFVRRRTGDVVGLQHERTQLAWERTSIAIMVAGVTFTRSLASDGHPLFGLIGVVWVVGGGWLLLWAARNDRLLHDPASPPSAVPQVWLTYVVGWAVVLLALLAFASSVVFVVLDGRVDLT